MYNCLPCLYFCLHDRGITCCKNVYIWRKLYKYYRILLWSRISNTRVIYVCNVPVREYSCGWAVVGTPISWIRARSCACLGGGRGWKSRQSVCLSVCLCLPLCLCLCLPFYHHHLLLPAYLSTALSVSLYVYRSIYLSIYERSTALPHTSPHIIHSPPAARLSPPRPRLTFDRGRPWMRRRCCCYCLSCFFSFFFFFSFLFVRCSVTSSACGRRCGKEASGRGEMVKKNEEKEKE